MGNSSLEQIMATLNKLKEASKLKKVEKKIIKKEPVFKEPIDFNEKTNMSNLSKNKLIQESEINFEKQTEFSNEQIDKLNKQIEILNKEIEDKNKLVEIKKEEFEFKLEKILKDLEELKIENLRLRNENLDLKGAVRIYCRIKPANKTNISYTDRNIEIDGKSFSVEKVYHQNCDQIGVFKEMEGFIESVMNGYKICIFAYGQTGSGKTYTMEGNKDGLIFNSLQKINKMCEKLKNENFKITFGLKYLEIYNENIIDLFTKLPVTVYKDKLGVLLKGCSEKLANSTDEIYAFMEESASGRAVAATECNQQSSRSHAVFMLRMIMENDQERREGNLVLIDLAGSERLNESKVENLRLKETQNINKSLSALGNVFAAIKRQDKHIPFRDSKLTHLMQEHLSGNSKIIMIVNVNPENKNETICSLRFATKVSECALGSAERTAIIKN